jgi:hypothetical protein
MKFKQKSFRKVPDFISAINQNFFMGLPCKQLSKDQLSRLGLDDPALLEEGLTFLPAVVGKTSDFNANGKAIVRRDLPKETASREFQYIRTELRGRDSSVQVDGSHWISFQRYPREIVPAPSVKVGVYKVNSELHLLIEADQADVQLLHKVNLALELFEGEFEIHVRSADGLVSVPAKLKLLNWLILRSGSMTKKELQEAIEATISPKQKKTILPITRRRLAHIREHNPEEIAIGIAGYKGYVVHNFSQLKISVLESENPDNATYVFNLSDWEKLSKLTKTEIISNKLALRRIIHDQEWESKIATLLR